MALETGTVLDKIIARRRERLADVRRMHPLELVRRRAEVADPVRPLNFAAPAPHIIAEVKKASPSKGLLRPDFDPVAIGRAYDQNGAVAISVLTEEDFFQGSLEYLVAVREAVKAPVLRKDFLFDPYQIYEARAAGADLFLLIMAMLDDSEALALKQLGESLGMTALIEVHDAAETERALRLEPSLLGINNRNLRTFETRLEVTLDLLSAIPSGVRVVSESGFADPRDLDRLREAGVDTFLIGESFMRETDPGAALQRFRA